METSFQAWPWGMAQSHHRRRYCLSICRWGVLQMAAPVGPSAYCVCATNGAPFRLAYLETLLRAADMRASKKEAPSNSESHGE